MSRDELAVVIGATRKERIPALVCARSILERASCQVRIVHCYNRDFEGPPGPTGFSFQRFATPDLVGRRGRALYVDSDMLILADVRELLQMDLCGNDVLIPKHQAAVLLMDASMVPFSLASVLIELRRNPAHDIMMLRRGMTGTKVGRFLSDLWNSRDKLEPGTKNLHYTNMQNQPWLASRPFRHPHADLWFEELADAVEDGLVLESELREDVGSGHLHEECLEALIA